MQSFGDSLSPTLLSWMAQSIIPILAQSCGDGEGAPCPLERNLLKTTHRSDLTWILALAVL